MRTTLSLLSALALCGPASALAQSTPAPAQQLVDASVKRAAAEHKVVLVDIGASWCGWCHKFEAFLADSTVGPIMKKHFVELQLVGLESGAKKALENPGIEELVKTMNGAKGALPDMGLPYFFILDAAGHKIGDSMIMPDGSNVGHPDKPDEVDAFDKLLIRTAPHMTVDERGTIRSYLDRIAGRGKVTTY